MPEKIKRTICQRVVDMAEVIKLRYSGETRVRAVTIGGKEVEGVAVRMNIWEGKVVVRATNGYEYADRGKRVKALS